MFIHTYSNFSVKYVYWQQKTHKVSLISLLFVHSCSHKNNNTPEKKEVLPPCMLHRVNSNCSFSHSVKIILFALSLNLFVQSRRGSLCALYSVPLNTRIGRSATGDLGSSQMKRCRKLRCFIQREQFGGSLMVCESTSMEDLAPFSSLICYLHHSQLAFCPSRGL